MGKPLTDTTVKKLKPQATAKRLFDGGGLYLQVQPNGTKAWRLAYRFLGKPKVLACGLYPTVTLAEAREKRDAAKRLLANGIDPSAQKQAKRQEAVAQAANTFQATADEWMTKRMRDKGERTQERERWLIRVLSDSLGNGPMRDLTPSQLLTVLRAQAEDKEHYETASRMLLTAKRVFTYGIATQRCDRNIALDIAGSLTPPTNTPRPALVEPEAVQRLLRDIDGYTGRFDGIVGLALKFLALTAVRPGELAAASWNEFDLDAAKWTIPKGRMKMRKDHTVPLSRQALAILKQVKALTGKRHYVFSLNNDVPMSDNTLNKALRKLGYDTATEHCAHGFRSTFSTLINEEEDANGPVWHPDVVELSLAHVNDDSVRAAYNRAKLWPARARLMQHWADRIDALRDGAKVIPLKQAKR